MSSLQETLGLGLNKRNFGRRASFQRFWDGQRASKKCPKGESAVRSCWPSRTLPFGAFGRDRRFFDARAVPWTLFPAFSKLSGLPPALSPRMAGGAPNTSAQSTSKRRPKQEIRDHDHLLRPLGKTDAYVGWDYMRQHDRRCVSVDVFLWGPDGNSCCVSSSPQSARRLPSPADVTHIIKRQSRFN